MNPSKLRLLPLAASLIVAAGCPAEVPEASEVGATSQAYEIAPWANSMWNLYSVVDERPIRVCTTLGPGVTSTTQEALRLNVLFAVFDWVNSVQPWSGATLNSGVDFNCTQIDGVPIYDVEVYMNAGNGRAWNHGWRIDLYEAEPNLYQTVLHEFGHSFGMNDTYVEGVWTCKPNQPASVMCNASFSNLQTDDIRGARQAFRIVKPYWYNGPRPLEGAASGRCIDAAGFGTGNGTPLQLWDCSPGPTTNQVWEYDANTRAFVGEDSGRCLDVSGGATHNGAAVQLWDCHGGPNQQWELLGDGRIRNVGSGRCLDATDAGTGNGTPLQIWDCWGGDNQVWWM